MNNIYEMNRPSPDDMKAMQVMEYVSELEKENKEFYWHDFRLPKIDKNIDYSLDYKRELDRLISLGYRQYCIDFDYRCNNVWICVNE